MIGTIMSLKVTGERVFVLEENLNGGGIYQGSYRVRRPVVGPNGITHSEEYFTADELESVEDSIRRELSDILLKRKLEQELYEQFQAEQSNKQASQIDEATEQPKEEKKILKFTN